MTLEQKLYNWILSWLDTHDIGPACNEAVARKLAQRIATRLGRAGMLQTQAPDPNSGEG